MPRFNKEFKLAKEMAFGAGDILRRGLKTKRQVKLKGRVDLVTEIDLKSEKYIKRQIGRAFPQHAILAEESGRNKNESAYVWVVDPLDGTTNYAHGHPAFCVSIGLEVEERMVLGVIYDPLRDEMFYASSGGGAFLNRRRIAVSEENMLADSLLATGFPYDIAETKIDNLDNFARLYKLSRGIRRGGSAALDICYLACGRFDGFWELKLHAWDTAAGLVIAREAGAKVTNFKGGEYSIYNQQILATNGRIHRQIQKVLLKK
ncbi:MAG: inositol monophosphatase [FCB group bacterium]|nr:inositol monophosphatase [FCB group bacterium]